MTWQPKNLTRGQMAERRAEGARLLQAGEMSQAQIARHLDVSEATISKWKKTLAQSSPKALQLRKASGRPPKLTDTEKQKLIQKLEQGALASGFPTERWTRARVRQVIKQEFGVSYHRDYISRLLHGLGWRVQKMVLILGVNHADYEITPGRISWFRNNVGAPNIWDANYFRSRSR